MKMMPLEHEIRPPILKIHQSVMDYFDEEEIVTQYTYSTQNPTIDGWNRDVRKS